MLMEISQPAYGQAASKYDKLYRIWMYDIGSIPAVSAECVHSAVSIII